MLLNTIVVSESYIIYNFESDDTIKGEIPKRKSEKLIINDEVILTYKNEEEEKEVVKGTLKSIKNYTHADGSRMTILIIDTGSYENNIVEIDSNTVTDATVIHIKDSSKFDENYIYISNSISNYDAGQVIVHVDKYFIVGVNAFATLGEAVKKAPEGALIYIANGTYKEDEEIIIDKSLFIYGEDKFDGANINAKITVNGTEKFSINKINLSYKFDEVPIDEDKEYAVIALLGDMVDVNIANNTINAANGGRGIIAKDGNIEHLNISSNSIISGKFKDTNKYLGAIHVFSNITKSGIILRNNLVGSAYFNREVTELFINRNTIVTNDSSAISFGTKVSGEISVDGNEIIGSTNGIKFNGPETIGETKSTDFSDLIDFSIVYNSIMYSKSFLYIQGADPVKLEEKKDCFNIKFNKLLNDENSTPFIIDSGVEFTLNKTNFIINY